MNLLQLQVKFNGPTYTYTYRIQCDYSSISCDDSKEPSIEDFKYFCSMMYLDFNTFKAHYFYMCRRGLINDIQKFLDHNLLTKDMLNEGLSHAEESDHTNTVQFLLDNGAKNNRHYRMMLQSAIDYNNVPFLNDIISSLDYDKLLCVLNDIKLLKQMKKVGFEFDFNFNEGCLINRFARPNASKQFANLIAVGADPNLLLPKNLHRIKNKPNMKQMLQTSP